MSKKKDDEAQPVFPAGGPPLVKAWPKDSFLCPNCGARVVVTDDGPVHV